MPDKFNLYYTYIIILFLLICWTGESHSFYLDYLYYIYIFLILFCKASGSYFFIVIKQIVYVFLLFLFVKLEEGHSFDILVILYQSHLVIRCWRFKQLFWIYRLNLFGTKLTILKNGKSWHKLTII